MSEEPKTETHEVSTPSGAAPQATIRAFRWLVNFTSSVRLAVIILILLAAVSIIGTVLAQGDSHQDNIRFFTNASWGLYNKLGLVDSASPESVEQYRALAQDWGLRLYKASRAVGFDRLYYTWYFNLLLIMLSLNLVVCSVNHWPHTWRFFSSPKRVLEGEGAAGVPLRREIPFKKDAASAAEGAREVLAGKGYRAQVLERDGSFHLFAQKGLWGRLGIYVTHLSILVIFAGGIMGLYWGEKGFVAIEEGMATDTIRLRGDKGEWKIPFQVRCDDFEVTYYEGTGRPKDYKSKLTVLDGGQEVLSKEIEVNSPLIYQGIYFYQSSYGETGKGGTLKLRVGSADGSSQKDYNVPLRGETPIPEYGATVRILQFLPDFTMENGRIRSKSNQLNNPAVALRVRLDDGRELSSWLFRNFPDVHTLSGVDFKMRFLNYEGHQYTGLSVAYDPGVPVIWLGCALMVIGIFLAFFLPHRRLWVKVEPGPKGGKAWLAGSTNKNRPAFEEVFGGLAERLKERLASG